MSGRTYITCGSPLALGQSAMLGRCRSLCNALRPQQLQLQLQPKPSLFARLQHARRMETFIGSGIASGATNAGLPSAEVESVKVAVLAAGNFGIAMATLAARRKHEVVIYARDQAVVRHFGWF